MIFHTFGDKKKKAVIFIHGLLTPWQIWKNSIEHFEKNYFVIVPELDSHTEQEKSSFQSVEKEAKQIKDFVIKNCDEKIFMLCGLSMGGRIAATTAALPDIDVENLVLDGAPLFPLPKLMINIMAKNYIGIIRKSKKRNPKVLKNFTKYFMPENFLDAFLKIADNIEEDSLNKILSEVFVPFEFKKYDSVKKIFFMHGTKSNEILAKKSAVKMKEINPQTEIKSYEGYAHAQLACFESEKWLMEVSEWLKK